MDQCNLQLYWIDTVNEIGHFIRLLDGNSS